MKGYQPGHSGQNATSRVIRNDKGFALVKIKKIAQAQTRMVLNHKLLNVPPWSALVCWKI